MKEYKVIPVKDYAVVVDGRPIFNELCYTYRYKDVMKFGNFENSYNNECFKIIATIGTKLPGIPEIKIEQEYTPEGNSYTEAQMQTAILQAIFAARISKEITPRYWGKDGFEEIKNDIIKFHLRSPFPKSITLSEDQLKQDEIVVSRKDCKF